MTDAPSSMSRTDTRRPVVPIQCGMILASRAVNRGLRGYWRVKVLADPARGVGGIPKRFVNVGVMAFAGDIVDGIQQRDSTPIKAAARNRPVTDRSLDDLRSNVNPAMDARR